MSLEEGESFPPGGRHGRSVVVVVVFVVVVSFFSQALRWGLRRAQQLSYQTVLLALMLLRTTRGRTIICLPTLFHIYGRSLLHSRKSLECIKQRMYDSFWLAENISTAVMLKIHFTVKMYELEFFII